MNDGIELVEEEKSSLSSKKKKRSNKHIFVVFALLSLICVSVFAWVYFIFPDSTPLDGRSFNKGENALWLRYLWYSGDAKFWSKSETMIEHLKIDQIRYAYFHVRELKADGLLALKYEDKARRLTSFVHSKSPDTKVLAWVSLGAAYPAHGTFLNDKNVRKNAVSEAIWLVRTCGFDGIQWDYEPCKSGDADFLELLKESKKELGPRAIISVATPMCFQPGEASTWYTWDENYFGEVAALTDQIAVMCYDLMAGFPWQYVSAVKMQVPTISSAAAKSGNACHVIFGLPAYDRDFRHDHCETLRLSLKAVREGILLPDVHSESISGVGIFADYTMDEKEWALYRRYWLEKIN